MTMTSGGGPGCTHQTVTVQRPGFMVQVASPADSPPSTPMRATPAEQINLANRSADQQGRPDLGDRPVVPTDQQAATNNVGTPTSLAAPLQIINRTQASSLNAISGLTDAIAQQGAQVPLSTQVSVLPSPPPPPPATPTPAAPTPVAPPPQAFALVTTAGAGSGVPFLTASFAGTGAFNVSPILGFAAGRIQRRRHPEHDLARLAGIAQRERKRGGADLGPFRDDRDRAQRPGLWADVRRRRRGVGATEPDRDNIGSLAERRIVPAELRAGQFQRVADQCFRNQPESASLARR